MPTVPVQFTVPALVRAFPKVTDPVPPIANNPLLDIFRALPLRVPPVQLNWPLMTTGDVRLMVPLLTLTVSLDPGAPAGFQLPGLNQSLLAEPVQVLLVCAEAKSAIAKQASKIAAPTRKRFAFIQIVVTALARRPYDKGRASTTGLDLPSVLSWRSE